MPVLNALVLIWKVCVCMVPGTDKFMWKHKQKGCVRFCTLPVKLNLIACDAKEMLINKWPLTGKMNISSCFYKWYCVLHRAGESKYVYKLSKLRILVTLVPLQNNVMQSNTTCYLYCLSISTMSMFLFPWQPFPLNIPNIKAFWHRRQTDTLL